RLTNLPWHLDEDDLGDALGLRRVRLVNDLVATAAAVPLLRDDELHVVQKGEALSGGAIAVLAPGTGLGEAVLTADGAGYRPQAAGGGHLGFPPNREIEGEAPRLLWRNYAHVSAERVASGIGIPNIYDFLRDRGEIAESDTLAAALAVENDRTR